MKKDMCFFICASETKVENTGIIGSFKFAQSCSISACVYDLNEWMTNADFPSYIITLLHFKFRSNLDINNHLKTFFNRKFMLSI